MAANLLTAGNLLTVWNRSPEKAVDLVCDVAASPRDLGAASDIVFVCVSDTPDVEEVVVAVIHREHDAALQVDRTGLRLHVRVERHPLMNRRPQFGRIVRFVR